MTPRSYKYFIGIDPGVSTGICVWDSTGEKIRHIATVKIHEAMAYVKLCVQANPGAMFIRFEDARKRNWFGKAGREQLQGAGSIKRDCKIWEDYLDFLKAEYEMVAPKRNKTKLSAVQFKIISKYEGRTTEHARDAAMLVVASKNVLI